MLLPTLLVLTAAPVHLFVYSGADVDPSPALTMKKADPDAKVIDVTGINGLFHGRALFEDFDAFTRAPPAGWPEPLAPQWKQAMAYCRGTVGPPPWKPAAAVISCSQRITAFLWQAYFGYVHADRVFFVTGFSNAGNDTSEVTATVFGPAETEEHFNKLKGRAAELSAHVDEAIASLMKPALLQKQPRAVVDTLPALSAAENAKAAAAPDLFAAARPIGDAVKLPRQCDAMPATLSVRPTSVLAGALENRWMASVKGRAPTAACTLEVTSAPDEHPGLLGPMNILTGTLRCGTESATGQAPEVTLGKSPKPVDLMAQRLIEGLAKSYCR